MPRLTKGSSEEREAFMADVFRKYYQASSSVDKDLSVQKANDEFRKKFGSMLRNKRAYEIRDSVKAQVKGGGANGHIVRQAQRDPDSIQGAVRGLVEPGSKGAATLITGSREQLEWLPALLQQLNAVGLANARVDHNTDSYSVVCSA